MHPGTLWNKLYLLLFNCQRCVNTIVNTIIYALRLFFGSIGVRRHYVPHDALYFS